MPSPLLHSAAGASICLLNRKADAYFVVPVLLASLLPDADFIPGLLIGDPNRFHAGYSHSVGFALLAAGICALLVRRDRWRVAGFVAIAWCTHCLLDSLTRDGRPPLGVPLLWPLSNAFFNLRLLPSLQHGDEGATTSEFVQAVFSSANTVTYATEAALAIPMLCIAWIIGRSRRPDRKAD